jgi:hypothetical protein
MNLVVGTLTGLGATISLLGYFFKSDTMIFSGMALVILGYGASFNTLFNVLSGASNSFVAILLVSPIALAYVFLVIGWLRGRET